MNAQLMKRSLALTWMLALIGVAASMAAEADREAGDRLTPSPPRRLERAEPEGMRPMAGLGGVLTDDQRIQLRELIGRHRNRMLEIEEQLRIARRELSEVVTSGEAEEPAIRRRVAEVVELETARITQRLRLLGEIRPRLTSEQRERLGEWVVGMGPGPRDALRRDRELRVERARAEALRDRERREEVERRRGAAPEEREVTRLDEHPVRPKDRPDWDRMKESKAGAKPRNSDKDHNNDHD